MLSMQRCGDAKILESIIIIGEKKRRLAQMVYGYLRRPFVLLFFSLKYVATISLCSEHGDTEDNITLCLCVSVFKKLIIK